MKPLFKTLALVLVFGSAAGVLLYANFATRARGDVGLDSADTPTGRCETVRWAAQDLPVTLAIDPSVPAEQRAELEAVVRQFNLDFGERVFVVVSAPFNFVPVPRFVLVETINDTSHGHTAIQIRPVSCTFIKGTIQLPGLQRDPVKRKAAFKHELGHAVGLGHDFIEESFMWPKIEQWSASSTVTAQDRALVRRWWAIDRGT